MWTDAARDHSSFTGNRERLLEGHRAVQFLQAVPAQARVKRLSSSDRLSVNGTLLEARASLKSFRRNDGGKGDDDGLARPPSRGAGCDGARNAERDCHGEKRSKAPHRSTTDPEALLYRKGDGQPARRCDLGHVLMENRHGLAVEAGASLATGMAERETALELPGRRQAAHRMTTKRMTLGADKAYDVVQFIHDLRRRPITPHTAIDGHVTETGTQRETTIDRRTTRCVGHGIS